MDTFKITRGNLVPFYELLAYLKKFADFLDPLNWIRYWWLSSANLYLKGYEIVSSNFSHAVHTPIGRSTYFGARLRNRKGLAVRFFCCVFPLIRGHSLWHKSDHAHFLLWKLSSGWALTWVVVLIISIIHFAHGHNFCLPRYMGVKVPLKSD